MVQKVAAHDDTPLLVLLVAVTASSVSVGPEYLSSPGQPIEAERRGPARMKRDRTHLVYSWNASSRFLRTLGAMTISKRSPAMIRNVSDSGRSKNTIGSPRDKSMARRM